MKDWERRLSGRSTTMRCGMYSGCPDTYGLSELFASAIVRNGRKNYRDCRGKESSTTKSGHSEAGSCEFMKAIMLTKSSGLLIPQRRSVRAGATTFIACGR